MSHSRAPPQASSRPRGQYPNTQDAPPAYLPQYSMISVATLPLYPSAEELDIANVNFARNSSGQSERPRRTFNFSIGPSSSGNGNGAMKPWLAMRLKSNSPSTAQRPRFIGGEDVEGTVLLDLERPQAISSIVVLLRGRLVTSSMEDGSHVFLEHFHPVWKSEWGMKTPKTSSSDDSRDSAKPGALSKGKLCGRFEWPFSFPFPTHFPGTQRKGSKPVSYTTPQTLIERSVQATVIYEVIVKVVSGMFRNTHRIVANVLYVPLLESPDLPLLRSEAYRSGTYLCSPLQDEEGWSSLTPFKLRVAPIGNPASSAIQVECTIYIANPTTYTRGTVIPCYLVCRSDTLNPADVDQCNTLEAFMTQQCISLYLCRFVESRHANQMAASSTVLNGFRTHSGEEERERRKKIGTTAVWWRPRGLGAQNNVVEAGTSLLEGELHLDPGLFPSCEVPFLSVSYVVSAYLSDSQDLAVECLSRPEINLPSPPATPTRPKRFSPPSYPSQDLYLRATVDKKKAVASLPVKICTVKGEGPLPVHFMPRPVAIAPNKTEVQDVEMMGGLAWGR
ncbi:hypothetical protein D9611_013871 [Ephemerocybe angulata]|uniref:Arrestin-like N-terminal domain-containing protein n=1 Tax=Ephemerocybe angulata TaxID=980116 RepID=A0A8H5F9R6_9AGAR|nr:hypothetical protein D9611_013871 [Tulosesus angulatus]